MVKNPPASAGDSETQVRSLGQEDPLEKAMATHSSVLAGEWLSLLPTQRLALEEMLVHQALGGTETHCGHNSPRLCTANDPVPWWTAGLLWSSDLGFLMPTLPWVLE